MEIFLGLVLVGSTDTSSWKDSRVTGCGGGREGENGGREGGSEWREGVEGVSGGREGVEGGRGEERRRWRVERERGTVETEYKLLQISLPFENTISHSMDVYGLHRP